MFLSVNYIHDKCNTRHQVSWCLTHRYQKIACFFKVFFYRLDLHCLYVALIYFLGGYQLLFHIIESGGLVFDRLLLST